MGISPSRHLTVFISTKEPSVELIFQSSEVFLWVFLWKRGSNLGFLLLIDGQIPPGRLPGSFRGMRRGFYLKALFREASRTPRVIDTSSTVSPHRFWLVSIITGPFERKNSKRAEPNWRKGERERIR